MGSLKTKRFVPRIECLEGRQVPDGTLLPAADPPQPPTVELLGTVFSSNQESPNTLSSLSPFHGKLAPALFLVPVAVPAPQPPNPGAGWEARPTSEPVGSTKPSDLASRTTFPVTDAPEGFVDAKPVEESVTRRPEKPSIQLTSGLSNSASPSRGMRELRETRRQEKNRSSPMGGSSTNTLPLQVIHEASPNPNYVDDPQSRRPGTSLAHRPESGTKRILSFQDIAGVFQQQIPQDSLPEPSGLSQNHSDSHENGDFSQNHIVPRDNAKGPLDPEKVADFFAHFWGTPGRFVQMDPEMNFRGDTHGESGVEGVAAVPVLFGIFAFPVGDPLEPVAEGYQYLCNYSRNAIHAAERRSGLISDHEDIIQQICVEWLEEAGPPEIAFPKLLKKSEPEMQLLRDTVNRVISRVIYQQRKNQTVRTITECPTPAKKSEMDWTEFKSDCEQGVGHLTPREWHILELRRQGKTFAEIGAEFGMRRQRIWEIYHNVETRLQKIFGRRDL